MAETARDLVLLLAGNRKEPVKVSEHVSLGSSFAERGIIEAIPKKTTADTGTIPVITVSSSVTQGSSHLPAMPTYIL